MGTYAYNATNDTLDLIAGRGNTDELAAKLSKTSDNIAPKQETNTASELIPVGKYFINANGDLCQCDVQIASGGTIIIGSNCHVISDGIGNELNGNSVETGTLTWTRQDDPSVSITTDYTIVDNLIFVQVWNVSSLKDTDWTLFNLTNSSKTFASLGHQPLISDSNVYNGYVKGEIRGQRLQIYRNFSGTVLTVGTIIARVLS